jgi:5'-nucleotidase
MTRILVTNDDGVFSEGIKLLAEALAEIPEVEVTVVAPDREQSATGHSLTLRHPLRLQELRPGWYAVDGTPTDCVSLAVLGLMQDRRPDLVVSGINFGTNLGDDVTYSGTVSAAFEGNLLDLPAVAFSQEVREGFSFEAGARFARLFIETLLQEPLAPGLLLNVNIPGIPIQGVRLTRLGRRRYDQVVTEKLDPRGKKYYWIAGTPDWTYQDGTDQAAIHDGWASVTPLHLDLTDYPAIRSQQAFGLRLAARLPDVP